MRNNDSVICLSYRLWNTTKHLSVNIKSCHAVIDIRFNPSRANSSDNYNFVSFPLKSRNGVLVALQNAYYFQHILPLLATCLQGEIYFRSSLHPKSGEKRQQETHLHLQATSLLAARSLGYKQYHAKRAIYQQRSLVMLLEISTVHCLWSRIDRKCCFRSERARDNLLPRVLLA